MNIKTEVEKSSDLPISLNPSSGLPKAHEWFSFSHLNFGIKFILIILRFFYGFYTFLGNFKVIS